MKHLWLSLDNAGSRNVEDTAAGLELHSARDVVLCDRHAGMLGHPSEPALQVQDGVSIRLVAVCL